MATQTSTDGKYIDISVDDHSKDALGRAFVTTDHLIVERIPNDDIWLKIEGWSDEGCGIALSPQQGAELRDWLISLNL